MGMCRHIQENLKHTSCSHPQTMPGCVTHHTYNVIFTSGCFLFAATCKSRRRWYCSGCSSWDIKASSSARCPLIGWGCFSYTAGNTLNNMVLPVEETIKGMMTISLWAIEITLLPKQKLTLHLLIHYNELMSKSSAENNTVPCATFFSPQKSQKHNLNWFHKREYFMIWSALSSNENFSWVMHHGEKGNFDSNQTTPLRRKQFH